MEFPRHIAPHIRKSPLLYQHLGALVGTSVPAHPGSGGDRYQLVRSIKSILKIVSGFIKFRGPQVRGIVRHYFVPATNAERPRTQAR